MVVTWQNICRFVMWKIFLNFLHKYLKLFSPQWLSKFKYWVVHKIVNHLTARCSFFSELAIFIIRWMVIFFCKIIEKKVTKVDIVTFFSVRYVCDASKVNKCITSKNLFAIRSQRSTLSTTKYIKLPKITHNIDLQCSSKII